MSEDEQRFLVRLQDMFYRETAEHLLAMRSMLDQLKDPHHTADTVLLLSDFVREVHSLKGAAGAVEHRELEYLSRSLEQFLIRLQRKEISASASFFDIFHEACILIEEFIRAHENGTTRKNVPLEFYDHFRRIIDVGLNQQ